jgi:hypothetical protein
VDRVYCDTSTLPSNLARHPNNPVKQAELAAVEEILSLYGVGSIELYCSRQNLRETERTKSESQRRSLRQDHDLLTPGARDERPSGSWSTPDGSCGVLCSDVQDEKILKALVGRGLERCDAIHITQAICNDCSVFLTDDLSTIIRPHGAWIQSVYKIKIQTPSEYLADYQSQRRVAS